MAVDTLFKWRDGNRREVEKKNSTIAHFTFPVKIAFTLYHMHNWLENFVLVEIEINNSVCEVSWLCVNFMYVCIISCALAVFDFVWLWTYRSEKKLIASFSKVYNAGRRASCNGIRSALVKGSSLPDSTFVRLLVANFRVILFGENFIIRWILFFSVNLHQAALKFFFDWTNNWLRHIRFWSC